jgi:hypothetical protein
VRRGRTRPAARATPTTRRKLRWLQLGLLAATAVALAGCVSVFLVVHRTADTVSTQTTLAILDVHESKVALLEAHGAAARSFARDEVLLGAGEDYPNQMAVAGQSLTRVAENNPAGDRGSQQIQVIEALLVSYTELIERAGVHFRQSGEADDAALVSVYVRDASAVLGEILARLDQLRAAQTEVLDRQVGAGWMGPAVPLAWLVPVLVLLVLLVLTQLFLSRRFRRTLNLPLVAATALTVLLAVGTSLSLSTAGKLDDTRNILNQVEIERQAQTQQSKDANTRSLSDLLARQCRTETCRGTVEQIVETVSSGRLVAAAPSELPAVETEKIADQAVRKAEQAADGNRVWPVLPIVSVAIAVFILFGLQPRIEEYRYRRR